MKLLLLIFGLSLMSLLAILVLNASSAAPFDYYILSLSWAPEFCAQPGEAAANPWNAGRAKALWFTDSGRRRIGGGARNPAAPQNPSRKAW